VIYGHGSDPIPVTLDRLEFRSALNAAGANAVITIDVDGQDYLSIVKELQRDTIANKVSHVDFQLVRLDELIVVDVPVYLTGEALAAGRQGAVVQQQIMTLSVQAPAGQIPQSFEIDIEELAIETPLRVSDLVLPDGVISQLEIETVIAIAQISRATLADTTEDELAVDGDEATDGGDDEASGAGDSDGAGD
jgi:large subunit ribosomal protein L25|tara:strand:- start:691 stop:1266 length:576 start_codon:yes stop_codon:yes gene_type:complete